MDTNNYFPKQAIPFNQKGTEWRKRCVKWAEKNTVLNSSLVRQTVAHQKINYDLVDGILHMSDVEQLINPDQLDIGYSVEQIQHHSIMNTKLELLRGEEEAAQFDFRVVATNPTAISTIEKHKKEAMVQSLQQLIASDSASEEEFNSRVQELSEYFTYNWQDMLETRANLLLNHYYKEYNIPSIFNAGFVDVEIVGEEIYQCDIIGGEPTIQRLNPMKVTVYRSGYSNKIEDADMIVYEDYWNPGRIIDTFHDVLTAKDIKTIETLDNSDGTDDNDPRNEFITIVGQDDADEEWVKTFFNEGNNTSFNDLPYDIAGNVRVLRVYWKSKRKIKKVKSYDYITGEEVINYYPETYIANEDLGEEETIQYINEAWEGTMIGTGEKAIFVNMRPRPIQYNRISDPSRCHFGIIGTVYNTNENVPYSMVDKMKPYNYLYDVMYDRLNKTLAENWGQIIELDMAKVPDGWDIDKWMYFAKVNKIAVKDSFKEGNIGAATGKLAGGLNNNSTGVINAELGNSIQNMLNVLEYIKSEMADIVGISKQREGQISNRETVGGVERATLQSTHITKWLFALHNDVKKRVLECFLETAKIALRGRNKKFQYILDDGSSKIMEINGDEFADADYGLIVDCSTDMQMLNQKIDVLAQAAMQNGTISFATMMKVNGTRSLSEKTRIIEHGEALAKQQAQEMQQQQLQANQQIEQMKTQLEQMKIEAENARNTQNNETQLLIANMQLAAKNQEGNDKMDEKKLQENVRQFNESLQFDKEKLNKEMNFKEKQLRQQSQKPNTIKK